MKRKLTRLEKDVIRGYALHRERAAGNPVLKVRLLLKEGDARAYCDDGSTYLIAPISVLFAEVKRWAREQIRLGRLAEFRPAPMPVANSSVTQ